MRQKNPTDILGALAALHTGEYVQTHAVATAPTRVPTFVTISRQAGAGGRTLARLLAERLNRTDPGDLPWTVWDNELVERVAAESHLPPARIQALEDERPSWFEEMLGSLAFSDLAALPTELKVYHRVAATIRALAEIGRVVIVGRGGAFITHDLPGGVHLRLVAPLPYRVAATEKAMHLSPEAAAAEVRNKDQNREAFYRRHWPGRPLTPESFTATFNTAAVPGETLVESVLPLIAAARARSGPVPMAEAEPPRGRA